MTVTPKQRITQEAKTLGFDAVGFATADPVPGAGSALETFIAEGRHGDMAWLATTAEPPEVAASALARSEQRHPAWREL